LILNLINIKIYENSDQNTTSLEKLNTITVLTRFFNFLIDQKLSLLDLRTLCFEFYTSYLISINISTFGTKLTGKSNICVFISILY